MAVSKEVLVQYSDLQKERKESCPICPVKK